MARWKWTVALFCLGFSPNLLAARVISDTVRDECYARLQAEESTIHAQIDLIEREIEVIQYSGDSEAPWGADWAGEYYTGDGLGVNVTIYLAPMTGIAYRNYGCMGLYDADYGTIVESLPDGLHVNLALGAECGSFLRDRLYFVCWGDRKYLVPENRMLDVVNAYNQGGYSRSRLGGVPKRHVEGESYRGSSRPDPEGPPQLAPEYAKLILEEPIALTVSAVSDERLTIETYSKRIDCLVEFSTGSDAGVFEGMELEYGYSDTRGTVWINEVTRSACKGRLMGSIRGKREFSPPCPGDKIWTDERPLDTGMRPAQEPVTVQAEFDGMKSALNPRDPFTTIPGGDPFALPAGFKDPFGDAP